MDQKKKTPLHQKEGEIPHMRLQTLLHVKRGCSCWAALHSIMLKNGTEPSSFSNKWSQRGFVHVLIHRTSAVSGRCWNGGALTWNRTLNLQKGEKISKYLQWRSKWARQQGKVKLVLFKAGLCYQIYFLIQTVLINLLSKSTLTSDH